MISVFSGLFAGALHVVSGPDHLSAVAPLSAEKPDSKWTLGIRWGVGHSGGVIVVGLLALAFRDLMPLELLSGWAERLVGILLVGIGLWGVRKALRVRGDVHTHVGGEPHAHMHVSLPSKKKGFLHSHAAFGIGILHGIAGGAHFLGVLPALAFPTVLEGVLYLACYGLGTVISMGLFSGLVGLLAARCLASGRTAYKALVMGLSVVTIGVGVFWLGM